MSRITKKNRIITDIEYDAMEKGKSINLNLYKNTIVFNSKQMKPKPRTASLPIVREIEVEINNV